MRVISAPLPDTNADILEAFRRQLAVRDLAPATTQAYLHDLARFQTWLAWVHEDTPPLLTQVRTVDLAAFDTGQTPAKATIAKSGRINIDASSLPQLSGKRYEVWLTDKARTKMQPVGWLTASESPNGSFEEMLFSDCCRTSE